VRWTGDAENTLNLNVEAHNAADEVARDNVAEAVLVERLQEWLICDRRKAEVEIVVEEPAENVELNIQKVAQQGADQAVNPAFEAQEAVQQVGNPDAAAEIDHQPPGLEGPGQADPEVVVQVPVPQGPGPVDPGILAPQVPAQAEPPNLAQIPAPVNIDSVAQVPAPADLVNPAQVHSQEIKILQIWLHKYWRLLIQTFRYRRLKIHRI